jgi:hypothetical protein
MDLIQKVKQEKRERLSGKRQQEEDLARLALEQLRVKESQFASKIHQKAIPSVQARFQQNPNLPKTKISDISSIVYLPSILEPDLCFSLKEIIMGQEKSCWENLPHSKRRLQKYGGDV